MVEAYQRRSALAHFGLTALASQGGDGAAGITPPGITLGESAHRAIINIRGDARDGAFTAAVKSALIGAGVLAFALSFDETMITILVTGTQNTLPLRLWAMMRLGFTPDINALVAIILALTTVLVLVAARYLIPKDFAGAEA
jgi:hypothetical protein